MRPPQNRRDFLKISAAGLAGTAFLAGAGRLPAASNGRYVPRHYGEKPSKIIFFISDGMSQGVLSLTESFSQMVRGKGTHFAKMMQDETMGHGWFETYALNSHVTDSAAASCAFGSGTRILNDWLNMLPGGRKLEPILRLAKQAGYGTGVVTTATVTHATPAGFVANSERRWFEADFAEQYLGVVDVAMGGGKRVFDPEQRDDGVDLLEKFREQGYHISLDREDALKAGGNSKLLGLYANGFLPYTLDQQNDRELLQAVPTLAEMTGTALEVLGHASSKGFVVQVEGARVDHAAHANDAAGLIWDQLAFDDALGVALEYQRRNPETLIVVTSDHGNSNPGLNGAGGGYMGSMDGLRRLPLAKATTGAIRGRLGDLGNGGATPPADVQDVVKELLGIELNRTDASYISDMTGGQMPHEFNQEHRNFNGIFNQIIGNHTCVGWCGTSHTEDYVVLAASGPGHEAFNKLLRNTDAFHIMTHFLGIDHVNETMNLEKAMELA